jgi:MoaA/NifB/PqqE/SkfB family radical SAM enzyme
LDDESRRNDLIKAAKRGMSKKGCCRAAGITIETLNDYLERAREEDADERFIEFFDRFKRARSKGEKRLVEEARANGDAKFLLATSFGYSKKQQIEHSGEIDAGVMRVQEPASEDEWEEEHGGS